jgi:KDO2-lipid IV(A) lauroyltransferase
MNKLRTRFCQQDQIISFKQTFRTLAKLRDQQVFAIVASDQTPHRDEINYWTGFLNQETPFFLGIEKMATALDHAVVYMDIQRNGRGHYQATAELITDNPKTVPEHEIIGTYVSLLENSIRAHPDNWLWSHRRWKYKKQAL